MKERGENMAQSVTTRKETSYLLIKKAILSGELKPGDTINEKRFVSELGFSRTPVREALTQLSSEGLVEIQPSRGMSVSRISVSEVKMLYQTRFLIEPFLAGKAAENPDKNILDGFSDRFSHTIQSSYLEDGSDLDNEFHSYLASCTGNPFLIKIESNLMAKCQMVRLLSSRRIQERANEAREEHLAIIKAIEEGDKEASQQAMRSHLESSLAGYRKIFTSFDSFDFA